MIYFYSQYSSTIDVRNRGRTRYSAYDRPGTLSTFATRLDANETGEIVPYWAPFDSRGLPADHGRLLERLLVAATSEKQEEEDAAIVEMVKGKTILFFGDSNERSIVDELCIKLGVWPQVISSSNPPAKSERWHADSHSCEIEKLGGVRLISFMSYGVLIERGSRLWEKKLELNGPWAVEERIELAKEFVAKMEFEVDLIVFNSSKLQSVLRSVKVELDTDVLYCRPMGSDVSSRLPHSSRHCLRVLSLHLDPRNLHLSLRVRAHLSPLFIPFNSSLHPDPPPSLPRSRRRFLQPPSNRSTQSSLPRDPIEVRREGARCQDVGCREGARRVADEWERIQ